MIRGHEAGDGADQRLLCQRAPWPSGICVSKWHEAETRNGGDPMAVGEHGYNFGDGDVRGETSGASMA
jgi:hypothetical protein